MLLDAVARPLVEDLPAERSADLLDEPRPPDEEARPPEADAERPPDEDFDDADFLLPPELALRLPDEALLLPVLLLPEARPEDWLRDFFIDIWFENDDYCFLQFSIIPEQHHRPNCCGSMHRSCCGCRNPLCWYLD